MKREKAFLCPFCGAPYKERIPAAATHVLCHYCKATILVPSRLDETVPPCPNHPEVPAFGLCNKCGKSFCGDCLFIEDSPYPSSISVEYEYLCTNCLDKRYVLPTVRMVTKKLVDLKKGVEKVKATITDEELEDLYDRIIHRKGDVYAGSPYIGGRLRDLDIKKYVKNGLSRKEAILKIASEGNHEIILGLPFNPTLDDALKAVKRKMGSKIIDTLELKRQKQKQEGKLKRQKQEEYIMKYASDLYAKYQKKYPHNPLGVLELHINRKMKRGLIREEAIKELQEEVM